jgi:predicted amidohydrolase YtcJ
MKPAIKIISISVFFSLILFLIACTMNKDQNNQEADLLLYHAYVYPVSADPIENGAVVIRDGKIILVGSNDEIVKDWEQHVKEKIDCHGDFLMPGFIDGHGHFNGLGNNLLNLDLLNTRSWNEIVDSVKVRAQKAKPGEWIVGRGWHQEKWDSAVNPNVNGYPYNDELNAVSPNNPVLLSHASGHALIANKLAMENSHVTKETPDPVGGRIVRDGSGVALGVFEENAMEIIYGGYKEFESYKNESKRIATWMESTRAAGKHCIENGITSFEDAGSTLEEVKRYQQLAMTDSLPLRLYVMIHQPLEELKGHMEGFPVLGVGKEMFTCRAIKAYIDGALGSYGAWMLQPYADKAGWTGQNVTPVEELKQIADFCMESGFQMCVHAIGDKANRTVLDIYEEEFNGHPDRKDLRWRIEHAQHIDQSDMPRFKQLGVIASMQGNHCTSDAPFVVKRLGEKRAKEGAYAWRSLLDNGVVIANGTDTPVERVDPIPNFYALVTRKRVDTGEAFFSEQCMTRKEALKAYTLANAYAAFEENIKGSIATGKWADLVLLSQNLLNCPEDSILKTKVLITMVGGKVKYQNDLFTK